MGHEGEDHGDEGQGHGHSHDEHEHAHGHAHDHDHHSGGGAESRASFFDGPSGEAFARVKRILHVDAVGGAAGDMLIASLLDLGVPIASVMDAVEAIGLSGFRCVRGRREKHAIAAESFDVEVDEKTQPPRDYATIRALLDASALPARVRILAQRAFLRLGEAESKIHRQPLERVHFHEVGSVDAIVDVVGACAAVAFLEAEAGGEGSLGISIAPLPVGAGRARGAHGSIPVPAPAALELMIGLPVRDALLPVGVEAELVTPTGAALLRAFSELLPSRLGAWPTFSPLSVGYGAGRRELADRPNVLRLVLGVPLPRAQSPSDAQAPAPTHVVLEANVDDTTGEIAATVIECLLEAGALDAWAQPITMKKGRPALTVSVLAPIDREHELASTLLAHSGSLGVRHSRVTRTERPRRFVDASTPYGSVRVKIADSDGLPRVVHPELEDCRARAAEHGVPVREVIRAAIAAVG